MEIGLKKKWKIVFFDR